MTGKVSQIITDFGLEVMGETGWWKKSSAEDVEKAYRFLLERGVAESDIFKAFELVVSAVRGAYGE